MSTSEEIRSFKNPTGYWEHHGAFAIELTDDADKSIVPSSARVEGNIVRVANGRIKQSMGGIDFYSGDQPFGWGYPWVKMIKDGEGRTLWVNINYSKM